MSSPLMLRGAPQAAPDDRDRIIASLKEDNRDLQEQVAAARRDTEIARSEAGRAIAEVRKILSPLYNSLRVLFGEMDTVGDTQTSPSTQPTEHKAAVWESWKQRLGGQKAKCIDAFLTHGALTATQLRVIVGCATSSVPGLLSDLRQVGLLDKNGSKYSLKQL